MTVKEAEEAVGIENVERFWQWMEGQTLGVDDQGETEVYDEDVERFLKAELNGDETAEDLEIWD